MINAGMNTTRKNEVKENLMRLCFGGVAIALAPLFIRFLLYMNNSLVYLLVTAANTGTLDATLGNSMLTSIKTGNAISTALVIAMFIYLFVKLNIKFIVRQFTIIIFTIFTPIAAGLWIINKNVTAASIWAGQIIMNIFMQFIYCFLFLIYLAFLPSGGGWAGCEDPRAVCIDDKVYMTFHAFNGWDFMRQALTSISLEHLAEHKWHWKPPALISQPNQPHKKPGSISAARHRGNV